MQGACGPEKHLGYDPNYENRDEYGGRQNSGEAAKEKEAAAATDPADPVGRPTLPVRGLIESVLDDCNKGKE